MKIKSHICKEKLAKINIGQTFEYSAVASEELPVSKHAEDSIQFKSEVENGLFDNIIISDPNAPHVKYKKTSNEI